MDNKCSIYLINNTYQSKSHLSEAEPRDIVPCLITDLRNKLLSFELYFLNHPISTSNGGRVPKAAHRNVVEGFRTSLVVRYVLS